MKLTHKATLVTRLKMLENKPISLQYYLVRDLIEPTKIKRK